jgi:hypothetical protein
MLCILGRHVRPGLTRREVLRVGGLGFTGLVCADWLKARAAASERARAGRRPLSGRFGKAKSCILIFNYGGPSHLDTFDLKPDAPGEVRGDFRPMATSVPGVSIGWRTTMRLSALSATSTTITRSAPIYR